MNIKILKYTAKDSPLDNPTSTPTMPDKTNPPSFPLLRLPTHLRQKIYNHALLSSSYPNTITIGTPTPKPHLNLLLTSRKIHTEALPLLYTNFTYHFPTWTTHDFAFTYLASLTPYARSAIRVIAFEMVSVTPARQKEVRELKLWKAGFPLIARELTGLRCVRLGVGGVWKGEVVDEAVAILRFFVSGGVERFEVVGVGGEVGEEVRRRLRDVRDVGEGVSSSTFV